MPVQHSPCSTHVKRNSAISTAVMVVDFAPDGPAGCDTTDIKMVRTLLSTAAKGQGKQQPLTLVDVFHLVPADKGSSVKIRVMNEQICAWIQRGTPLGFYPRPLGPSLEQHVTFFDKQIRTSGEAQSRYAEVAGFLGLTLKHGETWGAIFTKESADRAAVALGKAPGITYRITGLPVDMPLQELETLLGQMQWNTFVIIDGSRRMHRGTATWLIKSTAPPPVTSLRLSHSESHQ
eukprot:2020232-Amphidinium_carterae.1